jgi:hypothetical protein
MASTLRFGISYEEVLIGWIDSLPWIEEKL